MILFLAMDAAEKVQYDLFIIDLMLPPTFRNMSLEMLKYVKSYSPHSEVLMISSKSDSMTKIVDKNTYQLGARRFLDKEDKDFITNIILIIKEIGNHMCNSVFISHGHADFLKYQLSPCRKRWEKQHSFYRNNPIME